MAIITTFAVDTVAMLVGVYAGRSRLAPTISPKKSWEGAVAGVVAGILVAIAIDAAFEVRFNTFTAAILGGSLGVTAILGDLYESWIKRRAGVKDSGRLIPGHGGILDRLDSVIPCLVVVYWTGVWSGL
jgi:phosphatidate cytidylyltransferase